MVKTQAMSLTEFVIQQGNRPCPQLPQGSEGRSWWARSSRWSVGGGGGGGSAYVYIGGKARDGYTEMATLGLCWAF